MSKRKRFNPLEEMQPGPEGSIGLHPVEIIAQNGSLGLESGKVERIERLKPGQMIPDRFQPRRLLPGQIRRRFFDGEIDCYQAALEWLRLAESDPAWKIRVQELLDMGGSFEEQGQIKPITGVWVEKKEAGYVFQIETGERRFWAACLWKVKNGMAEEPELRIEVVNRATRQRQVLENRHAQNPSAVGQACEVAALMLEEMGIDPDPSSEDELDYFRIALTRRTPRGLWPKLEPIMQHSTRRMQQLLAILQLPLPLLELADRHRLPERVLREILLMPQRRWRGAIEAAIHEGLTSEDIAQMDVQRQERVRQDDGRRSPERIAFTGLRRFLRAVISADPQERAWILDGLADELVVQGMAEEMLPLLKGLKSSIETRMRGN
jgi:hypothetical protein